MNIRSVLQPVFTIVLLVGVSACSASSPSAGPTGLVDRHPISPRPTPEEATVDMARTYGSDFAIIEGGNAGRARIQMGWDDSVTFIDISGKKRHIVDEANWKICTQESPGGATLVFGVVLANEHC